MKRQLEPELMNDGDQTQAYFEADVDAHFNIVELIDKMLGNMDIKGNILDLGCGPGNTSFKIAEHFPNAHVTGVDGSASMLALAKQQKRPAAVKERVTFVQSLIPSTDIPPKKYDLIMSTRFLHHLHQPRFLWDTINQHATTGTKIFIADLKRPESQSAAKWLVYTFANKESKLFKEDFYYSLLASFTPEEINQQLQVAGLNELSVYIDTYMLIYGELGQSSKLN